MSSRKDQPAFRASANTDVEVDHNAIDRLLQGIRESTLIILTILFLLFSLVLILVGAFGGIPTTNIVVDKYGRIATMVVGLLVLIAIIALIFAKFRVKPSNSRKSKGNNSSSVISEPASRQFATSMQNLRKQKGLNKQIDIPEILRRLWEDHVISEADYNRIKDVILGPQK